MTHRSYSDPRHQALYDGFKNNHDVMIRLNTKYCRAYRCGFNSPHSKPPKLNTNAFFAWQAGVDNRKEASSS